MEVLRKAFSQELDPKISEFVSSIEDDAALIEVDIQGSLAHAEMLSQRGLITPAEFEKIRSGLNTIRSEAQAGKFKLNVAHEDVHMNVEKKLEELIGEPALRLHTARSRNDQVALDLRLFILKANQETIVSIEKLCLKLITIAESNLEVVMPGYTHLQRAQPVSFAHVMLAFVEALSRDIDRFKEAVKRAAVSPLGAGAQAGTALSIDPQTSARLLGLERIFSNSIDAVSDRDFVADFLYAASLSSVHLSQMAETLIIWSTREFGFIEFSDAVTTTSSLMPQKKNLDPLEIVRGKTGVATGELVNLLMTLKGLPLGYNRDLQETKPPAMRVFKSLNDALEVLEIVVSHMTVNKESTFLAAADPEMMTTDLVEYLVQHGVPFRQAHDLLSQIVKHTRENDVRLTDLKLNDFQKFSSVFEQDVFALFDPYKSVEGKKSPGSTGFARIKEALVNAKSNIAVTASEGR
jgi:argininosuccinate lyase